jgi:hypothetical protein
MISKGANRVKFSFGISVVLLLLVFTVPAGAEDLNPPNFAGADQTFAVFWEFDEPAPEPAYYLYIPDVTNPTFAWDQWGQSWSSGTLTVYDGECRIYAQSPSGSGSNTTIHVQVTYNSGDDVYIFPELWSAPDYEGGDHLWGNEDLNPTTIDMGGGLTHGTWYDTAYGETAPLVGIIVGGFGTVTIHEIVLDAVVHDGDPPIGPGRVIAGGVEIIGDWQDETSDLSRSKQTGSNRALVFTAHVEDNNDDMEITSVTYGGQSMIKVIEENYGLVERVYVAAFILDDAKIDAATSGTFNVTWAQSPSQTPAYASLFLSGVDQTYPTYARERKGGTDNPISTDPLATSYGDMAVIAGTCSYSPGDYTVLNGFTKGIELSPGSADGVTGHKSATGTELTPSVEHYGESPLQTLIGFIVQADGAEPPDTTPPTPATSTWAAPPLAVSYSAVTMTATTASDPSGVEYYFEETTGNPGGSDSGWQDSPTYTNYALSPETLYTYRVKTRDLSPYHNEGSFSSAESATTFEQPVRCPDGDIDRSCKVDLADLIIFVDQWLDNAGCVGHPDDCADLDELEDGIGVTDFVVMAENWLEEGIILLINEVMASNNTTITDPQGEYDDWVEIYNSSDLTVDVGGMYLADSGNTWQIPVDRPAETSIGPHGHLIIWTDGDQQDTPGLHADFKLNAEDDEVHLYAADGVTLVDSISFEEQLSDISYGRYPDATEGWFNMSDPTPGYSNTVGMSGAVYFSHPGGTFTSSFNLGLTTESQTATIYYTLDGSEPTDISGTLYTAPFTISQTTWVRARAYEAALVAGPIVSKTYFKLHTDVQAFQSNLPIVVIDSFGLNIDYANRDFHPVISAFIATDETTGTAAITDPADYAGYGGMHIRGNSTVDFPKRQFRFETWDEYGEDQNVSLLGLPSESDWIIHGPWADRTLMRNYQMYTWSNMIGRYASRTVFVEVFADYDGNGIIEWDSGLEGSGTDYRGVYVLMEKIKRDDNRVDVDRLGPSDNSEPEVTGGYVLKKDWESDFSTSIYNDHLIYWDPEDYELSPTQKSWIQNYLNDFESALSGGNFDDPDVGYAAYIDVLSFVDHHILVEVAKNVDGFVLSTYLFKDRGGKINMGPIWDYNGALGAGYFCSYDPTGWLHEFDETCTDECAYEYATFPADNGNAYNWYWRLFEDPEFLLKYADRWFELREELFSTTNMLADIDSNVDLLTNSSAPDNAVTRNFDRWNILEQHIWPSYWGCHSNDRAYEDYVGWIKTWLQDRLLWMDGEIDSQYGAAPPVIKLNGSAADQGGHADAGDLVTLTGGAAIYYTTDGSDPREHGGAISPSASLYTPSIVLSGTVQIKARIKDGVDWSALNEATFSVGPVAESLRITELMYNPADPNTEFIELKNIGPNPINLNLVSFADGIDFTFPDITLTQDDHILVVENVTAFESKYGTGLNIAGIYSGRLRNSGERVLLQDALDQPILNFSFKDRWYHITDGYGFSLNIINTAESTDTWEYGKYWQASREKGGTPDQDYLPNIASNGDIVINEVRTHTDDLVYGDWIELHNTTASPINIGGWFLSDDFDNLKKYEIQPSDPRANLPANDYVVFNAVEDFRNPSDPGSNVLFGLSELGETVYLSSGSAGELLGGYCEKEDFKASENDVTFGRYTKSPDSGYDVDFVAMEYDTLSAPNPDPKVGPVVISEIMYHPASNTYAEYIELRNITPATVELYDTAHPGNTWQLTDEDGGIDYYLPIGTTIPANGYLLLVKNKTAFESEGYPAVPGGVEVLEWVTGRLSNAGEKVQISKPETPEAGTGFVPYVRVDRVNYSDGFHPENFYELPADPWPTVPDGGGQALQRVVLGDYGNDVANWQAASPSPGQ